VGGPVAEQRRAQGDAELAVLDGVHPAHRPRIPAAVEPFELGDELLVLRSAWLRADGRRRVKEFGQLEHRPRIGELGVDGRREVLDVGDAYDHRLRRALDPDRDRRQAALDPLRDDGVLGAVLVAVEELLAEVIVDGGIGAATRRSGEGHRRRNGAAAANEELRAGADERCLRRADAEAEARAEGLTERAEQGPGGMRSRSGDTDLAGEHELLDPAAADRADGIGDRLLVAGGRPGGADLDR
jgi:hypothetical protein